MQAAYTQKKMRFSHKMVNSTLMSYSSFNNLVGQSRLPTWLMGVCVCLFSHLCNCENKIDHLHKRDTRYVGP